MRFSTRCSTLSLRAASLSVLLALTACNGGGDNPPPANKAPVANAGIDLSAASGTTVLLDGSASSDANSDTLNFTWTQATGPAVILTDANSSAPSFIAPDVTKNTTLSFELTVSDGEKSATDSMIVTVINFTLTVRISDIKTLDFNWPTMPMHHYRLLENRDGVSGYQVIADHIDGAQTSHKHEIPVHFLDWANTSYLLEACIDETCASPLESKTLSVVEIVAANAIGYIKASNTDNKDHFGTSIAISDDGKVLAIGASGEDGSDNSNSNSGAVYIFRKEAITGWSQEAYLKASNADAYDAFGTHVSISGDGQTLAIGATGEDSNATGVTSDNNDKNQMDNSAGSSGAVYIFRHDGSSWKQEAYVKASNTGEFDYFGCSTALNSDGSVLAVGAFLESSHATGVDNTNDQNDDNDQTDNSAQYSGAAYIFRRYETTGWRQEAYIKASNTGIHDGFGSQVALNADGYVFVASAPGERASATGIDNTSNNDDDINQTDRSSPLSGAVYVFRFNGNTWKQDAYIKASNTGSHDNFGNALALNSGGNVLAVGATGEDSSATGVDNADNNNDNLDQADNNASYTGAVYLFRYNAPSGWAQEAYIKSSNADAEDGFGHSVTLNRDGNVLAVGAPSEDSASSHDANNDALDAGAVYLFRHTPHDGWMQLAFVKASNIERYDRFGKEVALNSDGRVMAVSSTVEASSSTGINGDQADNGAGGAGGAGAAYLY